jgi:hypothetical protein
MIFTYELPIGYSYFLKRITLCNNTFDFTTGAVYSKVKVKFNDPGHNRGNYEVPVNAELLSSPNETYNVPSAGTHVVYVKNALTPLNADAYSISFQAAALKFAKNLDYLTIFRSRIEIEFSDMVIASALPDDNAPGYIDLLINGRLNPELSEMAWGS